MFYLFDNVKKIDMRLNFSCCFNSNYVKYNFIWVVIITLQKLFIFLPASENI